MGMIGNIWGATRQASEYDHEKNMRLIEGVAARNRAYSEARGIMREAAQNARKAGVAMMEARGDERRAVGAARAVQGATGVMSSGSGGSMERNAIAAGEQEIANMALNQSQRMENSINAGIATVQEGEAKKRAADAEAAQYRLMAKATRTGAWISAATGLVSGIAGMFEGGRNAREFNANQRGEANAVMAGELDPMNTEYLSLNDALKLQNGEMGINDLRTHSVWQEALNFGESWSSMGSSAANAYNPWVAQFTTPGWERGLISSYVSGNRRMRGKYYQKI